MALAEQDLSQLALDLHLRQDAKSAAMLGSLLDYAAAGAGEKMMRGDLHEILTWIALDTAAAWCDESSVRAQALHVKAFQQHLNQIARFTGNSEGPGVEPSERMPKALRVLLRLCVNCDASCQVRTLLHILCELPVCVPLGWRAWACVGWLVMTSASCLSTAVPCNRYIGFTCHCDCLRHTSEHSNMASGRSGRPTAANKASRHGSTKCRRMPLVPGTTIKLTTGTHRVYQGTWVSARRALALHHVPTRMRTRGVLTSCLSSQPLIIIRCVQATLEADVLTGLLSIIAQSKGTVCPGLASAVLAVCLMQLPDERRNEDLIPVIVKAVLAFLGGASAPQGANAPQGGALGEFSIDAEAIYMAGALLQLLRRGNEDVWLMSVTQADLLSKLLVLTPMLLAAEHDLGISIALGLIVPLAQGNFSSKTDIMDAGLITQVCHSLSPLFLFPLALSF